MDESPGEPKTDHSEPSGWEVTLSPGQSIQRCYTRSVSGADPLDLTHERLAQEQRERGGPVWQAAVDYGIDVTLLERNMALTHAERLEQHDEALALYFARPR